MAILVTVAAGVQSRPAAPLAGRVRSPLQRLASAPPPASHPPEAIDRKSGPMYGDFWPDEHVPEWDDVCFEPRDLTPQRGEFKVYSKFGRVLDTLGLRCKALSALRHWKDAAYVVLGDAVVARKMDTPVTAGETAEAALAEIGGGQ